MGIRPALAVKMADFWDDTLQNVPFQGLSPTGALLLKEECLFAVESLLNFNSERVRVPPSLAEEPRWRVKHAGYELETWHFMLI